MFNKKLKIIIFFLPRITRMTTCIATVEPRAKVAHTALLHECARYFADDRCWCTIGPRTLGASGSGDVARRTVCTADARACDQLARHRDPRKRLRGRGDQAARALWSTCGPLTVFRAVQASYRAYLPRVPTDVRRTLVRRCRPGAGRAARLVAPTRPPPRSRLCPVCTS